MAIVADSTGALFAMIQTKGGDPADSEPVQNGWLWDEVWTGDVAGATGFYEAVLGLRHEEARIPQLFEYANGLPKNPRFCAVAAGDDYSSCIGSPDDARRYLRDLADVGVDQVIFLQQAGRNRHADICSSLELFASEVMPEFAADEEARQAKKTDELAPFVEAALARKEWMQPLADEDIPVVEASVKKAQTSGRI